MKILILGDAHGAMYILADVIDTVKDAGIEAVIQAGDFGFFPFIFKQNFGEPITKDSIGFSLPVYAIDGNHELHKWIHIQDKNLWAKHLNLHFVERGTILQFGSSNIAFLGGALNIDRKQTITVKKGENIYDSVGIHNFTLNSEKNLLVKNINSMENGVDMIVTHTCPHSIGIGMRKAPFLMPLEKKFISSMGIYTGELYDCGEQVLTDMWNELTHRPKHWMFGHFHTAVRKKIDNTYFSCVGCVDGSDGNNYTLPFIYDTETKAIDVMLDIDI